MLQQAQARIVNDNPFYGKHHLLSLGKNLLKVQNKRDAFTMLNTAWASCTTQDEKALFYILVMSVGDIQNREHRYLKTTTTGQIDGGGNSMRLQFLWCLQWMIAYTPDNFFKLMFLIGEYTNIQNLFYYQLRTDRLKGKVLEVRSIVPENPEKRAEFVQTVAGFLAGLMQNTNTPIVQHESIAKFLHVPKFSTRKRTYKQKDGSFKSVRTPIQEETREKEKFEAELCEAISEALGWEIIRYPKNTRYIGIETYKKTYLVETEATLFSNRLILDFDETAFHNWLSKIPSDARFRVQRRLFNKDAAGKLVKTEKWVGKHGNLADFYDSWLKKKDDALKVVKQLEVKKEQQGGLTKQETVQLAKAKKESKVNVGATNFLDLFVDIRMSQSVEEQELKAQTMLNAVDVRVPVLVLCDTSGSMGGKGLTYKNASFSRIDLARLATTIFLAKNPSPEGAALLGHFGNTCELLSDGSKAIAKDNRFMQGVTKTVDFLYHKGKTFIENYTNISRFLMPNGMTNVTSFAAVLERWVNQVSGAECEMRKEVFNGYQVLLIISDGEFNNSYSATSSLQQLKHSLLRITGWNGVIVVWDANESIQQSNPAFENVENIIHYGGVNPSILTTLFKNIHDLDIIDIYEPLLSLYRSNRYAPIREIQY